MESEEYKMRASSVRSAKVSIDNGPDLVVGRTVNGDEGGIHCGE